MPADTWLALNARDALLRAPDVNLELENPGSESSYVLSWTFGGVLGIDGYPGYQPPNWQHINATWGYDGTRPDSPARFTLKHVTLVKDATLTAPMGGVLSAIPRRSGRRSIHTRSGFRHSITNRGSTTADLFVVALEPAGDSSTTSASNNPTEQRCLMSCCPTSSSGHRAGSIRSWATTPFLLTRRIPGRGRLTRLPNSWCWYVLSGP